MHPLLLYIIIEIIVIAISWKQRKELWIIEINIIFSGIAAVIILAKQWPIIIIWFVLCACLGSITIIVAGHYSYSHEH